MQFNSNSTTPTQLNLNWPSTFPAFNYCLTVEYNLICMRKIKPNLNWTSTEHELKLIGWKTYLLFCLGASLKKKNICKKLYNLYALWLSPNWVRSGSTQRVKQPRFPFWKHGCVTHIQDDPEEWKQEGVSFRPHPAEPEIGTGTTVSLSNRPIWGLSHQRITSTPPPPPPPTHTPKYTPDTCWLRWKRLPSRSDS